MWHVQDDIHLYWLGTNATLCAIPLEVITDLSSVPAKADVFNTFFASLHNICLPDLCA